MSVMIMARIDNGRVSEIRRATPEAPFHPDLDWDQFPEMAVPAGSMWMDITDVDPSPGAGWSYDGKVFSAPTPQEPTAEVLVSRIATMALDAAPHPAHAAKATQASLAIILRTLKRLLKGETLTAQEEATFNALVDKFAGAGSAMADSDALTYIQAQLDKSDAADAVIKRASK